MADDQLALAVALMQEAQTGMQTEEAIERQSTAHGAGRCERKLTPQRHVTRIAEGWHRGESVERAPQYHEDQPLVALDARMREYDSRSQERGAQCERARLEEITSFEGCHQMLRMLLAAFSAA